MKLPDPPLARLVSIVNWAITIALAVLFTACASSAPASGSASAAQPVDSTSRAGIVSSASSSAIAASSTLPAVSSGTTVTGEMWLGVFPSYPGARQLCHEHVDGKSMHIDWSSYATTDTVAVALAFYRNAIKGSPEESSPNGEVTFAFDPDKKLSVDAANGTYPKCQESLRASEKAVIVVSQAIR